MNHIVRKHGKRGEGSLPLQVRKLRREFDGKTQALRGGLLADLETIQRLASEKCLTVKEGRQKQAWARIATYVAQTMTYIAGAFDTAAVDERLDRLEGMVRELKGKTKAETGGPGAPG